MQIYDILTSRPRSSPITQLFYVWSGYWRKKNFISSIWTCSFYKRRKALFWKYLCLREGLEIMFVFYIDPFLNLILQLLPGLGRYSPAVWRQLTRFFLKILLNLVYTCPVIFCSCCCPSGTTIAYCWLIFERRFWWFVLDWRLSRTGFFLLLGMVTGFIVSDMLQSFSHSLSFFYLGVFWHVTRVGIP